MIILVACSATKLDHRAEARDLYQGEVFKLVRRIAEHPASRVQDWAILSAQHGLVAPTDTIDPYDLYLGDLTSDERAAWHRRVLDQVIATWGSSPVYQVYAGSHYTNLLWNRTLPHCERVYATWAAGHRESKARTHFGLGHIRSRLLKRLAALDEAAAFTPEPSLDSVPTAPELDPKTHRFRAQLAWLFES